MTARALGVIPTARALGVDVGTTAVKVVALDARGRVAGEAHAAHDVASPRPGWAEAEPETWWASVCAALQDLARRTSLADVAAVGVSGMVPALVLTGAAGEVLRPAIQQNDARAGAELAWLADRLDAAAFLQATGQPLSQQLVPPKLLWLRRHEPRVAAAIRRVAGSYDWITRRLTGEWSVERNWALEAGLWNAGHDRPYAPMLAAADIPAAWLPPVRAAHEVVGTVTGTAAAETALPAGTPVIAGSADHVAAALAAGAGPGELVLKIGGAGDVLYGLDRFAPDPRLYIDYHDLPGAFLLNGCMATSGAVVKWFSEQCAADIAPGDRYARLDAEAAAVTPGSEGLVALPYFLGEKTPLLDPVARGVLLGLAPRHGRGHLHRALLEAVAYGFRHHLEIIEEAGHPVRGLRVMDGGARSALWRQIVADTLGRSIAYTAGAELGSAHGVAHVAGVAAGLWDWTAPPARDVATIVHEPAPAAAARYRDLYGVYRELYARLRPTFAHLAALTGTPG